jgi:hypothetical protein
MGQAKQRKVRLMDDQTLGDKIDRDVFTPETRKDETWKIHPLTVNFPKPLWDEMERIRAGIRVIRGNVPDPAPPDMGMFVQMLIVQILQIIMDKAKASAQAARKDALVKTPDEAAAEYAMARRS